MNPSQDQVKSAARTLIATLGGMLAGWAIGKGWITQEQATAILSNQEVMGAASMIVLALVGSVGSAVAGVWGVIDKKQVNLVAAVAAMPEVNKVETMPTQAGADLAANVQAAGPPLGAVVTVAET
jgi:hypothetical protein